jgi:Uma2 family endonuclease
MAEDNPFSTSPGIMLNIPTHHRFTCDEYERMVETGILTEQHPVELIRGEVLNKMVASDGYSSADTKVMLKMPTRHLFSVDDYERMVETGILTEQDRVELIRGEILEKMVIGDPHCACVNRLTRTLVQLTGNDAVVSVQNPVRLDESAPEPDIAVLRPRDDFYGNGKPEPADVILLIEVSDSSLDYDRTVKAPLYAGAGIREYWIVNLEDDCVEVHRDPQPDGSYRDVRLLRRGDRIELAELPGVAVATADVLG